MLLPLNEAARLLAAGGPAAVAGDEHLLRELPPGPWIGGTIPYFMGAAGGEVSHRKLFVRPLPCDAGQVTVRSYTHRELACVTEHAPDNGFTIVILPAGSEVHETYAREAPDFPGMFLKPVVGWVSGVHLDEIGHRRPLVIDGRHGTAYADRAIALHAALPADKLAHVGIVNLFRPGDGPTIRFPRAGFSAGRCRIGDSERNLAGYIADRGIDTRLPLVADYCGAHVNVSLQSVDPDAGRVDFYAPVFPDVDYRFARAIGDYVDGFAAALPRLNSDITFSCNCVLNFVYSALDGRRTGDVTGPMTFGEIAYQLLNQTMVYLTVESA